MEVCCCTCSCNCRGNDKPLREVMSSVARKNEYPQRAWVLETKTKGLEKRAWRIEERKMPHCPSSRETTSKKVFQGVVVANTSIQNNNNIMENLQETDPTTQRKETLRTPHHYRGAATTNRSQESDLDDTSKERPCSSSALIAFIAIVAVASLAALALTVMILTGFFGTKKCSSSDKKGKEK